MGTFEYGAGQSICHVDDRTLLHLQIVIITKLRRTEHFLFRCESEEHVRNDAFWMSPTIPLRFSYSEPVHSKPNRAWLHLLSNAANSAGGLWIVPEPIASPSVHPPVPAMAAMALASR